MSNNSKYVALIWLVTFGMFIGALNVLFNKFGWNFIFSLIFIVVIIWLILFFYTKKSPNNSEETSQIQSTPEQSIYPSNQTINNSSLVNLSSQNIQWTEIGTYSSNNSQANEQNNVKFENFIDLHDTTANTEELISNLIGQKDRVTGDVFNLGEKVYFCVPCQLGYHEDSWKFLNRKCEQCKSPNVSTYTLTVSRVTQQPLDTSKPYSKELEYLMSKLNQFNDNLEAVNLVKCYNQKLDFIDKLEVSETANSKYQRCKGSQASPVFERNNRKKGEYWIIDHKYLVPEINLKINQHTYIIFSSLFECINYGDKTLTDNLILLKPAKIKNIEGQDKWQLTERGIIIFENSIQEFMQEIKNNSTQFIQLYNLTTSSRNEVE